MAIVKTFDKPSARLLGQAVAEALRVIGEEYGVILEYNGGTINSDVEFVMKVRARVADQQATADSARKEFDKWCVLFGLEPKHFGAKVTLKGQTWTLVGVQPSRQKYPLVMRNDVQGKSMLYTLDLVSKIKAAVQ